MDPKLISLVDHPISDGHISANARAVLTRLQQTGFDACLVGGCVRDLMLGREPKDFDVVTDAHPEQVSDIFRNSRLVGRRFRLCHVRFGREIIEVATYRASHKSGAGAVSTQGRLVRDNVYGTQPEDALRRDFTINALYYSFANGEVFDYLGGLEDLQRGVLRMIGTPKERYREDPVRMLRVIRFAAKLGFKIEPETLAPVRRLSVLLNDVPAARMFEETLKLFHSGSAVTTFELLRQHGLFKWLFPLSEHELSYEQGHFPKTLLARGLGNTDTRVREGKPVAPAFLFAVALWEPMRRAQAQWLEQDIPPTQAMARAAGEVFGEQIRHISIPRRVSAMVREIWGLQARLERRVPRQVPRLLEHRRFRAAYDFLLLRSETGEVTEELGQWWTEIQERDAKQRQDMIQALAARPGKGPGSGRRGRGRRRGRRTT